MKDKVIIALDTQDEKVMNRWIEEFSGVASFVKIGMEAYYSFGPQLLQKLKSHQFKIFLDLKLHDIPHTVHKSCKTLGKLGVDILNVHAAGGHEMMKAALEGYREHSQGKLIAVTQLTSTTSEQLKDELYISKTLDETVLGYAQNAKKAGLDGVVCSPLEIELIHQNIKNFITVTPGIRPLNARADDQKRILTPIEAIQKGCTHMVIGRPITQSPHPKQTYLNILEEIQ
ncbi:MAG: orotidine-5'-phosphate decarboxylase [Halobacteriovoraceae bacterium]|nr:orotidine-5'-phosphate decarboxylase [Halobacteriovoraceae bacterium]